MRATDEDGFYSKIGTGQDFVAWIVVVVSC